MRINLKKYDFAILIISLVLLTTGIILKWFFHIDFIAEMFSIILLITLLVIFQLIRSKRIEDRNDITDAFYTTGVNQKLLIERNTDKILNKIARFESKSLNEIKELCEQNTSNTNEILSRQLVLSNRISELVGRKDFEEAYKKINTGVEKSTKVIDNQASILNLLDQLNNKNEISSSTLSNNLTKNTNEIRNDILESRLKANNDNQRIENLINKEIIQKSLSTLKETILKNQTNTNTIFSKFNELFSNQIELLSENIKSTAKKEKDILTLSGELRTNQQQILSSTETILNEFINMPKTNDYSLQITKLKNTILESSQQNEDQILQFSNKLLDSLEKFDKNIVSNQIKTKDQINFHTSRSLQNTYNQLDALQGIYSFLNNLHHPLPIMRGWPASPDFILRLINLIVTKKPKKILDIGSGVTGLIAAYCVKKIGMGEVTSLEHDKKFYEITKTNIKAHELSTYINLIYAPIKNHKIHSKDWLWYDSKFAINNKYDFIIVDGPPGSLQKHSRYPALPLLKENLSNNAVILLDDAARTDEQEIAKKWEQGIPSLKKEFYSEDEKGTFLFTYEN